MLVCFSKVKSNKVHLSREGLRTLCGKKIHRVPIPIHENTDDSGWNCIPCDNIFHREHPEYVIKTGKTFNNNILIHTVIRPVIKAATKDWFFKNNKEVSHVQRS